MDELGLVSNYTVKQYKVHKSTCNNDQVLDDVFKYTGKNAEEISSALKKGDLLDIVQERRRITSK